MKLDPFKFLMPLSSEPNWRAIRAKLGQQFPAKAINAATDFYKLLNN
jgi:hypothetical protein